MKHCILQDSSFLIATIDKEDIFHTDAVYIFQKVLENKDEFKFITPTLVFYETIVTLIKKGGVSTSEIERKLWNFLYSDLVVNVSLIETAAFKACKKLNRHPQVANLRTQDFIISNVGLDYDAQILTFDKAFRSNILPIHSKVYYCSSLGGMDDETEQFLADFYKAIGKVNINLDEIPF